jgi:hypothetical protein
MYKYIISVSFIVLIFSCTVEKKNLIELTIIEKPSELVYKNGSVITEEGVDLFTEEPTVNWNNQIGYFRMNNHISGVNIDSIKGIIHLSPDLPIGFYSIPVVAYNQKGSSPVFDYNVTVTAKKYILRSFKFLHWIRYKGLSPNYDLSNYGLTKINLKVDSSLLLADRKTINSANIKAMAELDNLEGNFDIPVSMDMESWPFYPIGTALNSTIDSLKKSIKIYKDYNPKSNLGAYSLPIWNRYTFSGLNSTSTWHQTNDLLKQVGVELDHIENYGYNTVSYSKKEEWKSFVKAQLDEVRRHSEYDGKPVYLWICPQYYMGTNREFIEPEFWKYQLETLYELGYDGFIIWTSDRGGSTLPYQIINFDPNSEWFKITLNFINTH